MSVHRIKRQCRAWTEAEIAEVKELWYAEELTADEIGRRFGVSRNAIIGLSNRRGWAGRSLGEPRAKKFPPTIAYNDETDTPVAKGPPVTPAPAPVPQTTPPPPPPPRPSRSSAAGLWRPDSCQWIEGDPRRDAKCGGRIARTGAAYCAHNLARAYRKRTTDGDLSGGREPSEKD